MSRRLTIQLPDQTSIRIDSDEWSAIAFSDFGGGGASLFGQLLICRHSDGWILVYVTFDVQVGESISVGELLPAGSADVESAIWRLAERFTVPTRVVRECIEQFSRETHADCVPCTVG
jgi:hypothetical protein